ncbi:MAG TPA: YdeI/OmpD-associated family protein [Candidatus Saccharimonadales bacterium]|nr:YdeI/OmpD-associated family protein [Candidatus Saccharimonadales bacterium]
MTAIHFEAQLVAINNWIILQVPKEASSQLPSRGQVMVKGMCNGVPLVTALEPDGEGSHWFRVDNDLQSTAKVGLGDTVTLAIEATSDWPEPDIPADVQAALDANPWVRKQWGVITPMARWEWLRWINSTAQPETRQRRIEVSCSKLMHGSRRPCCFNRNLCCVPDVSKNGRLLPLS